MAQIGVVTLKEPFFGRIMNRANTNATITSADKAVAEAEFEVRELLVARVDQIANPAVPVADQNAVLNGPGIGRRARCRLPAVQGLSIKQ